MSLYPVDQIAFCHLNEMIHLKYGRGIIERIQSQGYSAHRVLICIMNQILSFQRAGSLYFLLDRHLRNARDEGNPQRWWSTLLTPGSRVTLPERPLHYQEVLSTLRETEPKRCLRSSGGHLRWPRSSASISVPLGGNLNAARLDQTQGTLLPAQDRRGGDNLKPQQALTMFLKKELKAVIIRKIRVSPIEKTQSCKRAPSLLRLGHVIETSKGKMSPGSPRRTAQEDERAVGGHAAVPRRAQVAGGAIVTWDHSVFFLC